MARPETPKITKTCRVVLDDGQRRYPAGEFTLTEPEPGPTLEQFANAAFKEGVGSFKRLMPQSYWLVVIDGEREERYGLTKWIKLIDRKSLDEDTLPKQRIRRS